MLAGALIGYLRYQAINKHHRPYKNYLCRFITDRYDKKLYSYISCKKSAGKELVYFRECMLVRWQVYCVDCPGAELSELLDTQSGIKPKVLDKAIVLNVAPM